MKVTYERTKAHQRYKLKNGVVVPGATTVLGVISKPALMKWYYQCGVDGIDPEKAKQDAADVGTLAHWFCECHVKGDEPDTTTFPQDQITKATFAFVKFKEWWLREKMTLVASETQLASEIHGFGGTLDIVCRDGAGKVCLADIKTSKAIYSEYWSQVAAYKALWNENHPDKIERVLICRIGKKEDGDFEVQERGNLDAQWRVFEAALRLYNALKELR